MNTPKVDIIIPAYNQGHYLREAVQSALDQTWGNLEIIIIDDGSTDNTAEVGQSFTDPRVTYIFQENKGLSGARNTGIAHGSGAFISFLDSDDIFLPTKIENLMALFQADPDLGMAAGNSIMIDDSGNPIGKTYGDGMPKRPEDWLYGNRIHVGSALVKREWFEKIDPFDESLRACEDWDVWLRLNIVGCKMAWLSDTVSKYRVHGEQMTRETNRMKLAMTLVLDKIYSIEDLPDSWRSEESTSRASAALKAAARAFLSGDFDQASNDLSEAITLDPSLSANHGEKLLETLLGWAFSPSSKDPFQYMENVFDHLPKSLPIPAAIRKEWLGQMAENLAFENYANGNSSETIKYVTEAAKIAPSRLINRKLCGIYVRSLIAG